MGDTYREIMVKPETSAGKKFLKGFFPVMTGICVVFGVVLWPILILALVFLLLTIFVGQKMEVEYEYLYVNGELDIDAIYSKQKRKRICSHDMEHLEVLAPMNSHALDSYLSRPGTKYNDYTSKKEPQKSYILVFNEEKGQKIIAVELDDEIINDIRRIAPRKVNLY
ncbi:MAG: DUF6106 family protein [Lachnospiraceae bacterium]|nr:DUF6106 family protein [Lachnospiraceae bacterium]